MSQLKIVLAPDPVLRTKCDRVEEITPEILKLLKDMKETMYAQPGVGIAAPQVGINKQLIVIDPVVDGSKPQPINLINPKVIWQSKEMAEYEEGCFSFPNIFSSVSRPNEVKVKYTDEKGQDKEIQATGLLATALQHEIDHLNGILFIDYLSALKRSLIIRKMKKIKKEHEKA